MTFFLEMLRTSYCINASIFRPLDNQGFSFRLVFYVYIVILTGQAAL